VRLGVSRRNAAHHQQHLAQYHFGNRAGIGEGSVEYWNTTFSGRGQIHLVGTDAETADGNQLFSRSKDFFGQLGTGSDPDKMCITDRLFQRFSIQRPFMKLDIGITGGVKRVDCALVDTFNQQKLNFVFSE
jgi:hypothetical protein